MIRVEAVSVKRTAELAPNVKINCNIEEHIMLGKALMWPLCWKED